MNFSMSASDYFFNFNDLEQTMASLVVIAHNAVGKIHSHPQEQWSILIKGGGTRIHDGEHIPLKEGDF